MEQSRQFAPAMLPFCDTIRGWRAEHVALVTMRRKNGRAEGVFEEGIKRTGPAERDADRTRRWSVRFGRRLEEEEKIPHREKDVETQFTQALAEARRLFSSMEPSRYSEKKPGRERK
jgi:hypothetical protein